MFKKSDTRVSTCLNGCILCEESLLTAASIKLNGRIIKPNANFQCTSRNLVYIMICTGCKKFYVGETGDELRKRFYTHRSQMEWDYDEAPVKADPHIRICGNSRFKVYPFYRPCRNSITYRRAQEARWIRTLNPALNRLT